jgi:hypothetical protein
LRYLHYLKHPEYPNRLAVGCVCAGYLTGDFEGIKARERMAKSHVLRIPQRGSDQQQQECWLGRVWYESDQGNHYVRTSDGFLVVVRRCGAEWSACRSEVKMS